MDITLVDGPMPTSPALADQIRRKIAAGLGRFHNKVSGVIVRIKDLNGERGGVDKQCSIHAHLPGFGSIDVEERQDNYYAAVYGAITKLKTAVSRRVDRRLGRVAVRA